jgi:phospholipid-transporting ATPase
LKIYKGHYIENYNIILKTPKLLALFRDEEQTEKFLSICYNADSVLCCRVSPFQKSQIVHKMKQYFPDAITLAIGDGGNDVSMIMEANIGIGIIGEEGRSAANASDFSIGEFKLLKRLLFFHGRTNLNRISNLILYFFYKNIIFTISQFFFSPISLSSGQTIIDDWYITCYNLIFTAIPLCVTSLTDFDVIEEDGKEVIDNFPLLYKESRDDKKIFTGYSFLIVIIKGILISFIMFLFCIHNKNFNNKGNI